MSKEVNQVNQRKHHGTKTKSQQKSEKFKEKKCFRCGLKYPHEKICPAKGQKCRKCDKFDHFESCCISKNVKQIRESGDSDEENCYGVWNVKARANSLILAVKNWLMPMVTLFM